jgi:primosomal protein N' (replication factor Y)
MSKKNTCSILNVVPLIKIPLSREPFFYYTSTENISIGSLVLIPFSTRIIEGIVIGNSSRTKILPEQKLKNIDKILEKDFLTSQQIALAEYLSAYYFAPLGIVLKNFTVKRTALKVKTNKETERENTRQKTIELTPAQEKAVEAITQTAKKIGSNSYLLYGPSGSGKTEVYIHSILKLKECNPQNQFLILVPEKTLTPQAMERYGEYFNPTEIVLFSSSLKNSELYTNWKNIKSGKAKIIIGTRMSVFAPFKQLALIIVDEEQDMSFKQWEKNPRYDARMATKKLAEIYNCKIIFGSATPSIESFYQTQINKNQLLTLPELELKNLKKPPLTTILVDMRKERWIKNYSCISKKLKTEITYALKNKLQVLLFINRQGMSTFSICDNCKTVLRCPDCDHALIYNNFGNYKCPSCSYLAPAIPECSKCKKIIFKNIGLGTQKVEKEINSLFPMAKIFRIDAEKAQEKDFHKKIYQTISQGEVDILIGTQMITKGWDLPKMSLVGIIDADNMLTLPSWNTREKAWQDLVQISGRVSRPGAMFPGITIIQTYHPENKLFKSVSEKNYVDFYTQELSDRKSLFYPPFNKIAKLIFQDYNKKRVDAETEKIYQLLISTDNQLKITTPRDCFAPKIRGKFRKQLIIKFDTVLKKKSMHILGSLSPNWIIDIDPISII